MRCKKRKFCGLYRGTVFNNVDPLQIGRIQAIVPDVSNVFPTSWAMPCVPMAGQQMGVFVVPPVGAGVWVQFEQGDPDFPVWIGGFWGSVGEVPRPALAGVPATPNVVVQSAAGHVIVVSDTPDGGILLKSAQGPSVFVGNGRIEIRTGSLPQSASIVLQNNSVSVNGTALVVT